MPRAGGIHDAKAPSWRQSEADSHKIVLGDPVPWFTAPLISGRLFQPLGCRRPLDRAQLSWARQPIRAPMRELAETPCSDAHLFDEDRIVFYGVLTAPPQDPAPYAADSARRRSPSLPTMTAPSAARSAPPTMPRTIVLDPMLRAIADIAWDHAAGHAQTVAQRAARACRAVDDFAGVPLTAPVLIVPRVFDFQLCDVLVQFYDKLGGEDSGFLLDDDGKTVDASSIIGSSAATISSLRIRNLREAIRSQIVRRLVPADRAVFPVPGHADGPLYRRLLRQRRRRAFLSPSRQRQCRRAASPLRRHHQPQQGLRRLRSRAFRNSARRAYRAPRGGAVVFSCGALHQVTPVTRGRRYAFLAFLYGEADAALREANNSRLNESAAQYVVESDLLFPDRRINSYAPSELN